jgi:tetratricopeptide (TPR) repeat protein
LNDKGAALYASGNYTQALQYFNEALSIDPNYKEALSNKQTVISKMRNVS